MMRSTFWEMLAILWCSPWSTTERRRRSCRSNVSVITLRVGVGEGDGVCAMLERVGSETTTTRKFFYEFNSIVHTKAAAASSSFHRLVYQLYRAHHRLVERKTATHQFHSEEDSTTPTNTTIEFERAKFAINKNVLHLVESKKSSSFCCEKCEKLSFILNRCCSCRSLISCRAWQYNNIAKPSRTSLAIRLSFV